MTGLGSQTQVWPLVIWTQVFWIQMPWTFLGWHANDTIIHPPPLPSTETQGWMKYQKRNPSSSIHSERNLLLRKVNMPRPLQTKGDFFTSLCINEISSQPVRHLQTLSRGIFSWNNDHPPIAMLYTYIKETAPIYLLFPVEKDQDGINLKHSKKKKARKRETLGLRSTLLKITFSEYIFWDNKLESNRATLLRHRTLPPHCWILFFCSTGGWRGQEE